MTLPNQKSIKSEAINETIIELDNYGFLDITSHKDSLLFRILGELYDKGKNEALSGK